MTPVSGVVGLAMRLMRQWWPHLLALAAACGIVAVTIAGALGVGDSLSSGLRRLALARLGGIQAAVLSEGLFRAQLASETADRIRSQTSTATAGAADRSGPAIVPAIVMEVSLESATAGDRAGRTARATLLACDDLESLGFVPARKAPSLDTVTINQVLAESLGARAGDSVVLRITKLGDVPADSPLGRRTADSWSRRLKVAGVLPAEGLGEFSLRPTQVTGGLAVTSLATAQAILRRDVSSANVLLSVGGVVKLVDFGISKAATRARSEGRGNLVGTVNYMCPEQVQGADAGPQGDLFSLGVVLWELIAGSHPFTGETEFATMRAIREHEPPSLDGLVPGLPLALVELVRRCLNKDPEGRVESARALLAQLEDLVRRESLNLSPRRLARWLETVYSTDELAAFGVSGTGYDRPLTPAMTRAVAGEAGHRAVFEVDVDLDGPDEETAENDPADTAEPTGPSARRFDRG